MTGLRAKAIAARKQSVTKKMPKKLSYKVRPAWWDTPIDEGKRLLRARTFSKQATSAIDAVLAPPSSAAKITLATGTTIKNHRKVRIKVT